MDRWAWEQLNPWLTLRESLPVGALFCVLRGRPAGALVPPLASESSSATPRWLRGCGSGSLRISYDMPTRS